ncbi:disease resistance protein RGA2-like [Oryza glaberrima]|uniref:disease resistance protein RGA2-like n=1 Tax=Oryza glaberrima TaxID=4538 RepID=UPI00224C256D|nr:disease resistance protein RGA2-like [Oryza glaberrima]
MDRDEHPAVVLSAVISEVVQKLCRYLSNSSDSFKSTTKKLDMVEDKLSFLRLDSLQRVKPHKEEAAAAWLQDLNKAAQDAKGLLDDMESEVKAPDSSNSDVMNSLSSDDRNMIRMQAIEVSPHPENEKSNKEHFGDISAWVYMTDRTDQNYVFEKDNLVQMWIANGFIELDSSSGVKRLEDVGGEWFDELVNRAFLQPSARKTEYIMHDLVWDFASALSCDEYHGIDNKVLGLRGCTFDKLPGDMNSLINLRHLHASSDTIAQINGIGKLTKLQEVHEFHIKAEEGHRITELSDMNDLRGSLCISHLEMVTGRAKALEANIIEKNYLTALELRWSYTCRSDLSKSILGCLSPPRYLQELKLYGYSGFVLPDWVGQLKHVRVVEISSCKHLKVLPPLGQLEHLQMCCRQ